jgi:hypothetical protein
MVRPLVLLLAIVLCACCFGRAENMRVLLLLRESRENKIASGCPINDFLRSPIHFWSLLWVGFQAGQRPKDERP